MKPTYKIDNWFIDGNDQKMFLFGYVQRYEGNSTKNHIRTSYIVGRHGDVHIETKNSLYELGEPAEGYFKEEILNRITEL